MSTAEILRRVVDLLGRAQIPYMLVGSFASTFHGLPRTTQDIDLVIAPTSESLDALLGALAAEAEAYYVSDDAARDAFRRRSLFNIIDLATGWKVDLIVRKDRPFSLAEFQRREMARVFGVDLAIASAEDTILAKLEWAAAGQSERQVRDAAGVLSVKGPTLDRDYIERWASALGVLALWRTIA